MHKEEIVKNLEYKGLFEKGLDLEEVITITSLEILRNSILFGNLNNHVKKKMIKITDELIKDTLKHIKTFRDLIKNFENG